MNDKSCFRVLYIADNRDRQRTHQTKYIHSILERSGVPFSITVNPDTEDAPDMNSFDLVILDQVTAAYHGLQLARSWMASATSIPILMLTPFTDPAIARHARETGIAQFIIKDSAGYYMQQVAAVIEDIMRERGLSSDVSQDAAAQRAQRLNRSLLLLNRVGQLLTSTLDLAQITARFVETTAKLINTEGSTVWLFGEEGDRHLVCAAAYSLGDHVPPDTLKLPPGEGIAGWVAATGEHVLIANAGQDARFSTQVDNTLNFQTRSLLTVPLRTQDQIIGVLQLVNKRRGDFDEDDRTLAETLAASAAIAIVNAKLLEELRQRNQELEQQNAELDAYSDTVAHDLKNPITHFLSYADDLRENYHLMSAAEIDSHLEIILQQSQRMNAIIEELLLLARVRMTKDLILHPLDMGSVVDGALERLSNDIAEFDAQITLPDSWPSAQGYAPWIEGVWFNYISNGLKYGGEPPILELGGQVQDDEMAHFWIRDYGAGLTAAEQAKLFTPFPKMDRPRRRGHGLGLVIVKRIIERLGGQVWVESMVGQGSTFFFSLPRPDDT